jgi:hypothetical protein
MIAGRHPTLVTEPDESLRAFKAFERAFAASADSSWDRVVGFPGGRETVNVHWHESAGIWGLFVSEPLDQERKPVGRFWIAFGVADPNQHSSLNITVEMNPPHEGENPRTAGVFLRDSWGAYTSGIQEGSEAADSSKRSSANLPRPRVSSGKRSASASLSSSVRSRIQRCCATDSPATSIQWPGSRMASRRGGETMGLDLRSVVFAPMLAQMKKRAGDLRNVKGFPRTGIEA